MFINQRKLVWLYIKQFQCIRLANKNAISSLHDLCAHTRIPGPWLRDIRDQGIRELQAHGFEYLYMFVLAVVAIVRVA